MDKEFAAKVDTVRQYFMTGATKSYEWRIQQLKQLQKLITENEAMVCPFQ